MNRVALVTGASGGIGSAIAASLAEKGYALCLQYRSDWESVERLAASLPAGTQYMTYACDLTDDEATRSMLTAMHQRLGKAVLVVHAAGIAPKQMLFSDTDDRMMRDVFETDVYAVLRLTRLLLEDLRSTGGAVIVLSSMWGRVGASCEVLYSAAKAALIGFTKALAKELAPSGVRVNCIAPGWIDTKMNAHIDAASVEAFREETPLERLGTPKDIADAVNYLAEASFVTGQVLSVDGGIVI
ncbi:MAG: SDR family oxidoreductase [Clostridia bacterium]|nr:SDR family oxidoreductase [Clostridia bacterium]